MTNLTSFLNERKSTKEIGYTHTSLSGGSYYIETCDMDEFFNLYTDSVERGDKLYLTEKPGKQFPMLIDLDFRFPADKTERQYTLEMLKGIVKIYVSAASKYVDLASSEHDIVIMEKPAPVPDKKKNLIKDGVHIVIPTIATTKFVQQAIRTSCLEEIGKILRPLECSNTVDDIVDFAVIDNNNWFLYGSTKPGSCTYKTTHHWDLTTCEKDMLTSAEYVQMLSVRNKYVPVKLMEGKENEIQELVNKHTHKPQSTRPELEATTKENKVSIHDLEFVMMHLGEKRSDDYHDWFKAIMVIKNEAYNEEGLKLAERFSKQCEHKYDESRLCEVFGTNTASDKKITFGSALYWLKSDNPDAYYEYQQGRLLGRINGCRAKTDWSMANLVHHLYQERFACVNIQKKEWEWFEFREHRWFRTNESALTRLLATEVAHEFRTAISWENKRATESEQYTEQCEKNVKTYNELIHKLRTSTSQKQYMQQCTLVFEKDLVEWYHNFDEKRHLIAFDNGVYDLDAAEFRNGLPSDMMTFTTKYDYTDIVDYTIRDDIMGFYDSIFPNDVMRDYHLAVMGYCLHGNKFLEQFWILTGSGGNGKGVQDELNKTSFGMYYYNIDITAFTQKRTSSSSANPELAKAKGRRLMISTEPEPDDKLQGSRMKSMTGNDPIQARALFNNPFEFVPQFAIALQMNKMPDISGESSEGFPRRLNVVEFKFQFVDNPQLNNERKVDRTLKRKFATVAYAQQYMLILLEYYSKYIRGKTNLTRPPEVAAYTARYLEKQDVCATYFKTSLEHTGNDKDRVSPTDLFDHFTLSEYYDRTSRKKFGEAATRLLSSKSSGGTKTYRGMKLIPHSKTEFRNDDEEDTDEDE
jgi:P4 family phage/plasmid primase-like protien